MDKFIVASTNTELYDASETSVLDIINSKIKDSMLREDPDDAFYVGDLGELIVKHRQWVQHLPRVEPFYAVKCNPIPHVLAMMKGLNVGFDCASKNEIQQVLELDVKPSRIIFAHPCKQMSHLRFAAQNNVSLMTFDNKAELIKIKKIYPDAKLVLRLAAGDDSKCRSPLGIKFGCDHTQAPELLQVAEAMGLNVVGISFHVGSGCRDPKSYLHSFRHAKEIFDVALEMGFNMKLLDIGGGFPGTDDAEVRFEEFASVINDALAENFPVGCGVRIIAEPGRFYVTSAFTVVVNIMSKRILTPTVNNNYHVSESADKVVAKSRSASKRGESAFMYYVNDGVYSSFSIILHDSAVVEPKLIKERDDDVETYVSSVWGPSCDGIDRLVEHCELPELDVGEWVYFSDMGAYTMATSTEFNGFKPPMGYFVISKEHFPFLLQLKDDSKLGYEHALLNEEEEKEP